MIHWLYYMCIFTSGFFLLHIFLFIVIALTFLFKEYSLNYKVGLVLINSFSFYLSENSLSLSILHDNFAEYSILGYNLFTSLNIFCIFLLGCQVSAEKPAYSLQGNPLYVIICFPFAAFKIFYLSFAVLVVI